MEFSGLFAIAVTPFFKNSQVDYASLKTLIDFYIEKGVSGITILGIMGEVNKLSDKEKKEITEKTLLFSRGRVPVIVGCSSDSTSVSLELIKMAEESGAAAVMVAPPKNLNNEKLLKEHYIRLAEQTRLPIVLQDEPVTTGVKMSAEFIAELISEIKKIEYVKLEEAPTTIKISKVLDIVPEAKLFGGLGGAYFYEELERGAKGIMTGFAFPELLAKTFDHFTAGEKEKARLCFYKYLPLIRFEAQLGMGGVGIRKEIYRLRGAIDHSEARFPSTSIDRRTVEELKEMAKFLDLSF